MAIDTPDREAEVRRPAAPSGSTMPNPSLLRVNAVDSDGFLRCPSCGARVLATVQLMVRPALRIGPKGLGLFARNFASRRRIEREPLTEAAGRQVMRAKPESARRSTLSTRATGRPGG